MTIYTVDRRFTTSVQRTPRVLEVAEAFGLGLSDKEFVVYDNLPLEVRKGDVVYITGQSGAGKTLLLKDLIKQMEPSHTIVNLDDVALSDQPVVDQVGSSFVEAAEYLALAGISDAWIYLRTPDQLSGGQQYRLRLAKVIESSADVWVADEFGAVLDRVTAKVVAFNMQKVARRLGKTLIVATTHTDLVEELAPDLIITKRFREKVEVEQKETAA